MGGSIEQGPGDGQALAFAAGEAHPLLTDEGVEALGHRRHKVVSVGGLQGIDDVRFRGRKMAVGHVVAHRVVEEDGLLGDHADLAAGES